MSNIHPLTNVQFNEELLCVGMNALNVGEKRIALETELDRVIIVGRVAGLDIARVMLVYRHKDANILGVFAEDISFDLLDQFQTLGQAKQSEGTNGVDVTEGV